MAEKMIQIGKLTKDGVNSSVQMYNSEVCLLECQKSQTVNEAGARKDQRRSWLGAVHACPWLRRVHEVWRRILGCSGEHLRKFDLGIQENRVALALQAKIKNSVQGAGAAAAPF